MQGAVKNVPMVAAAFEFEFMGGSMGSVVGERFVRGVHAALDQNLPFVVLHRDAGARACRKGCCRSCRWPRLPPR